MGFDAVDRHRYILGLAYDTQTTKPDVFLSYETRPLGALTLGFSGSYVTGATSTVNDEITQYRRELDTSAYAYYSFRSLYGAFTPQISVNAERNFVYTPSVSEDPVARSRYVPSLDASLGYATSESSRLAIATEGGRTIRMGARAYRDSEDVVYKGVVTATEYLRITDHSVLIPSLKASKVSHRSTRFFDGNVVLSGRIPRIYDSLAGAGFDELGIRGYPGHVFLAREAAVGALDYRFPIARIFRGWGTNPAFLENLEGFVFGESVYIPFGRLGTKTLSSAGGGLKLTATVLSRVPLDLSLQYHRGFRENLGGRGEVFAAVNLGVLPF